MARAKLSPLLPLSCPQATLRCGTSLLISPFIFVFTNEVRISWATPHPTPGIKLARHWLMTSLRAKQRRNMFILFIVPFTNIWLVFRLSDESSYSNIQLIQLVCTSWPVCNENMGCISWWSAQRQPLTANDASYVCDLLTFGLVLATERWYCRRKSILKWFRPSNPPPHNKILEEWFQFTLANWGLPYSHISACSWNGPFHSVFSLTHPPC